MNLQESIRKDLNLLEAPIEMSNDSNIDKIEKYREIICKANINLNKIWEDKLTIPGLDYEELDDAIRLLGNLCENMEIAMNHGLTEAPLYPEYVNKLKRFELEPEFLNQKVSYEMVLTQPTDVDYKFKLDVKKTKEWIEKLGHIPYATEVQDYMLNNVKSRKTNHKKSGANSYKITMFVNGKEFKEYNF